MSNERATWTITPLPQLAPRARQGVLDCPHGRTTIGLVPAGGVDFGDEQLLAAAILRHRLEEGCDCADHLVQRVAAAQARL